jgi:hypothetical protein
MPINAHLAVKGRDGIARESALVSEVFNRLDHLYYTGVFTAKQTEGFAKRLTSVKTVAGLKKLAKDVKAMEDAVLYRNPRRRVTRRRTARRNPTYGIPPYVVPQDAKKGDRVAEVQELRHGGVEVIFGTASTDWDGRFELRVAWGKSSKVYKTAAGAEKAVAKWLTTGK